MGRRSIPHRPEALPMRATAHTSCRWCLPTILMLVYHTVDDWTTRSSSAEACRSTPAHPCRAHGLTPERCEAEVLLTVCIAVVVGGHGRVATAHQIAPWSRGSDLLSPTAVGAAFRSTFVGGLARSQSDMGIAQRRQSNQCTPEKVWSALICSPGHGYGPAALWTCTCTRTASLRSSTP